ncbi:MAG: MscL family protein [Patescibacteria group bacterium]|nr:MscL family protein [Patescibacteria group bacterium]MDE2172452.1 MscL family protein [Patescibacteria group bacterium]
MLRDFINFIRTRGIVGFAVGFIIGRAISDLVGSLVTDIINPVIGILLGSFGNLSDLSVHVFSASINYGKFLNLVINFFILAFIVYFGSKILRLERLDKPKSD